jgi:hypothetical protein
VVDLVVVEVVDTAGFEDDSEPFPRTKSQTTNATASATATTAPARMERTRAGWEGLTPGGIPKPYPVARPDRACGDQRERRVLTAPSGAFAGHGVRRTGGRR